MYPHQAHSFSGSDQHITRYVVARAYKAQNSSSFPPVTAAAAHALARRAVRPVSHTPSQSSQAPKWCGGARAKAAYSNPKTIEFSNAACNKCAPSGYKNRPKREASRTTTHASDPRAGILSAK